MITAIIAGAALLALQDENRNPAPGGQSETKITVTFEDQVRGLRFDRKEDGRVIVKAPPLEDKEGKGGKQTWEALTPEEFKKKYPDVVQKDDLEPLLREVPA